MNHNIQYTKYIKYFKILTKDTFIKNIENQQALTLILLTKLYQTVPLNLYINSMIMKILFVVHKQKKLT